MLQPGLQRNKWKLVEQGGGMGWKGVPAISDEGNLMIMRLGFGMQARVLS